VQKSHLGAPAPFPSLPIPFPSLVEVLALYGYTISCFGERFRDVMFSTIGSLSCFCSYTLSAPVPVLCKSGAPAAVLYGVGATFVGQFHTKVHIIRQPFNLNAQCHKDYFPSACVERNARSDTVNLVL